jgi:hypothetical protein
VEGVRVERARMVSWGQRGGKCLTTDGREVSVSAALLEAEDIVGNILRKMYKEVGKKGHEEGGSATGNRGQGQGERQGREERGDGDAQGAGEQKKRENRWNEEGWPLLSCRYRM